MIVFFRFFLVLFFSAVISTEVYAGSVNCNEKKLSRVERKICDDPELEYLDERFDRLYQRIKFSAAGRQFDKKNPEWELKRSYCLTRKCIKKLYENLTDQITDILLEQNPRYQEMLQECGNLQIPPECEVYAFDAAGLNIDYAEFSIDENYETHLRKIKVNRPGKCVVLALFSFEPTLWKVYHTPQTELHGVVLAYDKKNQMLQGVPVGTKVWRNQCLKGNVREAFIIGLAGNRVIETDSPDIGDKLPDENYLFLSRNIDVNATIQQELPNHEAVAALVGDGVLRPIDEKDAAFLIDRGYSAIKQWGTVDLKQWQAERRSRKRYCQDPLNFSHSMDCHYYILEKPLDRLPRGLDGVYGIVVFVPDGMTAPEKYENGSTSSTMRIHATLKELTEYRKGN